MSSRLVRSPSGRAVAVEMTTPVPTLERGFRFRVLGDEIGSSGFQYTGAVTGRPPLPNETKTSNRNGTARTRGSPQTWTEADRELALELVDSGLSQREVGLQLGVPRPTIGLWVQKRAAVAGNGDGPETTPGPHQHSI